MPVGMRTSEVVRKWCTGSRTDGSTTGVTASTEGSSGGGGGGSTAGGGAGSSATAATSSLGGGAELPRMMDGTQPEMEGTEGTAGTQPERSGIHPDARGDVENARRADGPAEADGRWERVERSIRDGASWKARGRRSTAALWDERESQQAER